MLDHESWLKHAPHDLSVAVVQHGENNVLTLPNPARMSVALNNNVQLDEFPNPYSYMKIRRLSFAAMNPICSNPAIQDTVRNKTEIQHRAQTVHMPLLVGYLPRGGVRSKWHFFIHTPVCRTSLNRSYPYGHPNQSRRRPNERADCSARPLIVASIPFTW